MKLTIKLFLYYLFFFTVFQTHAQISPRLKKYTDSLNRLIITAPDSIKVDLLQKISWSYRNAMPDSTIAYAQKALDLSTQINLANGKIKSLNFIGVAYRNKGNYSLASKYYFNALKAAEKVGNKEQVGYSSINIGNVYVYQTNYKEAIEYFNKALKTAQDLKNKGMVAYCYVNLGRAFRSQKKYKEARKYYAKTLEIRKELKDISGILTSEVDLAEVYRLERNYEKALQYFSIAVTDAEKMNNKGALVYSLNNIANIYKATNELDRAESYAKNSLKIASQVGLRNDVRKALLNLSEIYEQQGEFKQAYKYHLRYISIKDSLFSEVNTRQISRLQSRYESEKRETQLRLEKKIHEEESKRKTLIIYSFVGGLVLLSLLVLGQYINNRQKNKLNLLLSQRNTELATQQIEITEKNKTLEEQRNALDQKSSALETANIEITRKNKDIIASMNYAQRIQKAMLPLENNIKRVLPEHFILFKPRDIVSGDFYWFAKIESHASRKIYTQQTQSVAPPSADDFGTEEDMFPTVSPEVDKAVIAAVDCTGHGVPGAFMSLIGNELLNEIIIIRGITKPSQILEELQHGVRTVLQQKTTKNQDGMDIAICAIDIIPENFPNNNYVPKLQFAGAGNPLIYIQNNEMNRIKGNRISVGGYRNFNIIPDRFDNHVIALDQPMTFYIFSDGYQDQFGGNGTRKFMAKRFRQLLSDIHHLPINEQKLHLETTLAQWQGDLDQVDDILVMGIKLQGKS
ncbi:hypothetical protein BKI52_02345 [marine bacterium AO1-C]|nr:hypothetical protein BKI52_02345 [marine bacterium AO1-C]